VLCALSRVDPGDLVVLPGAMFADPPDASGARAVSPVTLDDLALDELEAQLDRPVKTANWLSEIWS